MRIGSNERIEIRERAFCFLARHDHACEALDVELMADARSRRHDAHILEGFLRPLQEIVALLVALEFKLHVVHKSSGTARFISDDRVIDDQIAGNLRIDILRIAAQFSACFTHNGKIDEDRHTREVLEEHARRTEFDLFARNAFRSCFNETLREDLRLFVATSITKDILQKYGERIRKRCIAFYLRNRKVRIAFGTNGKLRCAIVHASSLN